MWLESVLRTFCAGVGGADRRFFRGGECWRMGSSDGGSSGTCVVSSETQTATRACCNWSAAAAMRWSAAGVGSWQRKTSACVSLLSDGGTVAGESVRMYWRMEAISFAPEANVLFWGLVDGVALRFSTPKE